MRISDPDRALWEIYVFHEDIEERGSTDPPRVAPLAVAIGAARAPRIWEHTTHQAVYLGPMERVLDDFGNVFTRGVATPLNVHDWQVLSKSAAKSAFLLLEPESSKVDASRADRPPTASSSAGLSGDDLPREPPRTAR